MKVNSEDVININNALQSVTDWGVDRIDFWEAANGKLKVTIRMTKNDKILNSKLSE